MKLYIHVTFILFICHSISQKDIGPIVRLSTTYVQFQYTVLHLSANLSKNQKHKNTTDIQLIFSNIFQIRVLSTICFFIFSLPTLFYSFPAERSSSLESKDRPNYLGLSLCPLFSILKCPGHPSPMFPGANLTSSVWKCHL